MPITLPKAAINLNGEILAPEQAAVNIFDRGFLYGDSLYEVARTYGNTFLHLEAHLDRLEQSARLCHMTLGQSTAEYRTQIYRTLEALRQDYKKEGKPTPEVYCRIIVTRGIGKIGFGLNCLLSPTQYVIIAQPFDPFTFEQVQTGMKLQVSHRLRNDRRALDPAMKSGNYLNNLLAYLESSSDGFDDALLCDSQGFVTEGTTFNIFYVKNNIIVTPPLDVGILDGITRRSVLEVAHHNGFETRECRFPKARLYEADEIFMTSSLREVFPVTQVDHIKPGQGFPGKVTVQLRQLFQKQIREGTHS